ncbi:MAG: phenylalanine--tRNA ligase subunit alpha [Faecalibacterium sp.]
MKQALEEIRLAAAAAIAAAQDEKLAEELRVHYLGKKGEITAILKQMGKLSAEERPIMGAMANEVRAEIEASLKARSAALADAALNARLAMESIDITLPGVQPAQGGRHPIQSVLNELKEIFLGMGFNVVSGPEIELDHYNFEMMRMPKSHPARDTQDTFYITENILLRTQTSPIQIRTLEKAVAEAKAAGLPEGELKEPVRIIAPGRVYRSDAVDATHSPLFHQIEGLVVAENVTFSDLKGTLDVFIRKLYGEETKVRFRPHHFPYTEPSAEMDMSCFRCGGKGCSLCKGEGWIEILGCGMIHPELLENVGIDSEKYTGFAFGIGLERITTMRYTIDDMRLLYENDLRFLKQFN